MFKTPEEVKNYAGGEKIKCLECGKYFSMLYTHLRKHGITEKEYREKYNIPSSIKLVVSTVRGKMRESNNTPISVLQERAEKFQYLTKGKSVRNKMFNQQIADAGRVSANAKKTILDEAKIKTAHEIYMRETQRVACDFLGVKPPILHKWFDRLGLPKKCPVAP